MSESSLIRDFPLFLLDAVVLPSEIVPLHVFEDRYKQMIEYCLEEESEFGVIWLANDGLRPIGCACAITEVVERLDDGQLNIIVQGDQPFRIVQRHEHHEYPAGAVEFLPDRGEEDNQKVAKQAHEAYAELVRQATDKTPDPEILDQLNSYEMAATVDFGLEAKQGLLDLRSEAARLRLLTRLFRAGTKRLALIERAQARAQTNGKVHFG